MGGQGLGGKERGGGRGCGRVRHTRREVCARDEVWARNGGSRVAHFRVSATVSRVRAVPSPTLSPTDPVSRGLLTLCPAASSGPGAYIGCVWCVVCGVQQLASWASCSIAA